MANSYDNENNYCPVDDGDMCVRCKPCYKSDIPNYVNKIQEMLTAKKAQETENTFAADDIESKL